jgi:hypothetical protein
MAELPSWAVDAGRPSPHIVAAAVRVARMIDRSGSEISDLDRTYHQHASGAYYPEPDMAKGQALLVDCGLVRQDGTRLIPTPELHTLGLEDEMEAASQVMLRALAALAAKTTSEKLEAALDSATLSPEEREQFLLLMGAKFDDVHRRLIGEIGEELVVRAAKEQLLALGHGDLAAQVRRVSLGSDALGYDITAPRTTGAKRLLEAKAAASGTMAQFFLSRNELETGLTYPDDWFLVYCRVDDTDVRTGEVIGWCSAAELTDHVPADHGAGEWSSVCIRLLPARLHPGLPR